MQARKTIEKYLLIQVLNLLCGKFAERYGIHLTMVKNCDNTGGFIVTNANIIEIPNGFKYILGTEKTGLTIEDLFGNQYV